MKTRNTHIDNLIQYLLENITDFLDKDLQCLSSMFTSYEIISTPKDESEIELNINTKSGLINIIVKDIVPYKFFIFPNSLDVVSLLTFNCNELFLEVSDSYWLNKEGNIKIKRQKVYGLCCYFSFELVKL